jgi:c-di-GMP-binding flagellar brake protein YcgR
MSPAFHAACNLFCDLVLVKQKAEYPLLPEFRNPVPPYVWYIDRRSDYRSPVAVPLLVSFNLSQFMRRF